MIEEKDMLVAIFAKYVISKEAIQPKHIPKIPPIIVRIVDSAKN